jgi:hypothetical protein
MRSTCPAHLHGHCKDELYNLDSVEGSSQWVGRPCLFLLYLAAHKHIYVSPRPRVLVTLERI